MLDWYRIVLQAPNNKLSNCFLRQAQGTNAGSVGITYAKLAETYHFMINIKLI